LLVRIPFDAIGVAYPLIDRFRATKTVHEYSNNGNVWHIDIAEDSVLAFSAAVQDATRGSGQVTSTHNQL